MKIATWIGSGLLALFFLFAGSNKAFVAWARFSGQAAVTPGRPTSASGAATSAH